MFLLRPASLRDSDVPAQRVEGELREIHRVDGERVQRAVLERVARPADPDQGPVGEVVGVDDDGATLRQVDEVCLQRGRVHGHQDVRPIAGRQDVVVGEVQLERRDPGRVPAGARISAGKFGNVDRSLPKLAVSWVKRSPVSCMPSPESPAIE